MVAFISGGCKAARVVAISPGWLQNDRAVEKCDEYAYRYVLRLTQKAKCDNMRTECPIKKPEVPK